VGHSENRRGIGGTVVLISTLRKTKSAFCQGEGERNLNFTESGGGSRAGEHANIQTMQRLGKEKERVDKKLEKDPPVVCLQPQKSARTLCNRTGNNTTRGSAHLAAKSKLPCNQHGGKAGTKTAKLWSEKIGETPQRSHLLPHSQNWGKSSTEQNAIHGGVQKRGDARDFGDNNGSPSETV